MPMARQSLQGGNTAMNKRRLWAASAAAAALALTSTTAASAAPTLVAHWRMNEPAGATVMQDSAGSHSASLAGWTGRSNGAFFDFKDGVQPNLTDPTGHNITVPHSSDFNPDQVPFRIEFEYRNHRPYGNLIQKGQAGAGNRGGYWKVQLPQGEVSILFRGPGGSNAVRYRADRDYDGDGSPDGRLDNNQWHTIRAERGWDNRGEYARLWVDGNFVGTNRGNTGNIANSEPIYLGGKGFCNQTTITCDLFPGELSDVRITKG